MVGRFDSILIVDLHRRIDVTLENKSQGLPEDQTTRDHMQIFFENIRGITIFYINLSQLVSYIILYK